jgi:hypothetical protein
MEILADDNVRSRELRGEDYSTNLGVRALFPIRKVPREQGRGETPRFRRCDVIPRNSVTSAAATSATTASAVSSPASAVVTTRKSASKDKALVSINIDVRPSRRRLGGQEPIPSHDQAYWAPNNYEKTDDCSH